MVKIEEVEARVVIEAVIKITTEVVVEVKVKDTIIKIDNQVMNTLTRVCLSNINKEKEKMQ